MGNPVTWFELNTPDPAKEATFYGDLFGWHSEVMEQYGYTVIDTHSRATEQGSHGINGGFGQTTEGRPAMATIYVEGPDLQALLDKAESLGAKTILPIQESEMVTVAMFLDPFGNAVGLVKGDGSTRVSEGDNPPVTWFEIACTEPRKAWDFYRDLFGWTIEDASTDQTVYGMVDTGSGGQGIPGGIGASQDGQPRVTVYAQVDDLQKYLERAEAGGATTIVQPMPVTGDTSIALFIDPQGVPFGLFSYQH